MMCLDKGQPENFGAFYNRLKKNSLLRELKVMDMIFLLMTLNPRLRVVSRNLIVSRDMKMRRKKKSSHTLSVLFHYSF